jgi:hypothetical protein
LTFVEPVELPLAQLDGQPGQEYDDQGEQHPAATQQESHDESLVRGVLS